MNIGYVTRDDLRRLSGLEIVRGWISGEVPSPPIVETMNYQFVAAEEGRCVMHGTPLEAHMNPFGAVHGGWYGTVMDTCTACSVLTRLKPGQTYTTLEYKVNTIRAIPKGTEVVATGWCEHAGRSTGVAQGEIRGHDGTLYALGQQTVLIMKVPD